MYHCGSLQLVVDKQYTIFFRKHPKFGCWSILWLFLAHVYLAYFETKVAISYCTSFNSSLTNWYCPNDPNVTAGVKGDAYFRNIIKIHIIVLKCSGWCIVVFVLTFWIRQQLHGIVIHVAYDTLFSNLTNGRYGGQSL